MMAKRVLTMLLALILCLGLPCAVLADTSRDTDPPQWQQYGYDSLEELLTDWDCTAEDYYDSITYEVAMEQEYPAWKAEYLAAHPDFTAKLLAEDAADPLWSSWGYDSQKDFEADWEKSYGELLTDWELEDLFWDAWYAARRMRERVEMGGPAEGVGVMWMGEFVQFPDAQPATVNDRTMVPVRALMERSGAAVDYQDSTVILRTAEEEIRFRAGETVATLVKAGETSTIQMDAAPYIDQGRTYVPLRFFSQALGYDVLWDDDYKTAVILDPAAVIAKLDQNFQTVNRFLAAQTVTPTGNQRADANVNGKLTVFDSMNGNKTASLAANAALLADADGNLDLRYRTDMGAAIKLLLDMIPNAKDQMASEEAAYLIQLGSMELDVICNAEKGTCYLRFPDLHDLEPTIPPDAWLPIGLAELGSAMTVIHGYSVGALLYAAAMEYGGVTIYDELLEAGEELAKYMGDGCFTAVPGGRELTIDLKKLSEDTDSYMLEDLNSVGLKTLDLKLRVNNDGSAKITGKLRLDSGVFGVTGDMELNMNAGQSSGKLNFHIRNLLELSLNLESSVRPSSLAPRTAPPTGAQIISAEDM